MICAIFAKSSSQWRAGTRKAFLPLALRGDSSNAKIKEEKEKKRVDYLKQVVSTVGSNSIVRFGILDERALARKCRVSDTVCALWTDE